jgi:hypothetical protein
MEMKNRRETKIKNVFLFVFKISFLAWLKRGYDSIDAEQPADFFTGDISNEAGV